MLWQMNVNALISIPKKGMDDANGHHFCIAMQNLKVHETIQQKTILSKQNKHTQNGEFQSRDTRCPSYFSIPPEVNPSKKGL